MSEFRSKTFLLDPYNISAASYTVLGNDTTNLAAATVAIYGTQSLEFDKADGAANTKIAGAYRTLPPVDLRTPFDANAKVCAVTYCSAVTNVDYAFVRLGTDASNYVEWRSGDPGITAGRFSLWSQRIGDCYFAGEGADLGNATYFVVGVAFDAETNTLADIKFEQVYVDVSSL